MGLPLIYRRTNPLSFPGGRRAGFDSTHIAAFQTLFSAVIGANKNAINLVPKFFGSTLSGTVNGAPTFSIDGKIGPAASGFTAANYISFSSAAQVANVNCTMGAIISSPGGTNLGFFGTTQVSGIVLSAYSPGTLHFTPGGNQDINSGIALSGYIFVAASYLNATKVNFVVVNLQTGATTTATVAATAASIAFGETAYAIGREFEYGTAWTGKIAAVMHSTQYMTIPTLLEWAQRPWDFWYPPTVEDLIFSSLSMTATPVVTVTKRFLPLMGVGR